MINAGTALGSGTAALGGSAANALQQYMLFSMLPSNPTNVVNSYINQNGYPNFSNMNFGPSVNLAGIA